MPNNQQQGIPTANQEALQQPAIDPVFLLAGGLAGGLNEAATGGQAARDWYMTMRGIDPTESAGPWEAGLKYYLARHQNTPIDFLHGLYNSMLGGLKMQVLNSYLGRNSTASKVATLPTSADPTNSLQSALSRAMQATSTLEDSGPI
jgi:hypothetical protein